MTFCRATHRTIAQVTGGSRRTVGGVGNGLIFALVVALWAAYFVPLALRRYDEATKSATVDKLSALTRVVRRPQSGTDAEEASVDEPESAAPQRVLVEDAPESPAEESEAAEPVAPKAAERAPRVTLEPPRPRVSAHAHRVAARRRRRVLLTLLTALAATVAPATLGVLAWQYIAIPAGLIVAWLVLCRIMVRGELGIAGRAAEVEDAPPRKQRLFAPSSADDSAETGDPEDSEETVILSGQVEDVEPHRPHVMESAELESDALQEKLSIAVPVSSASGEALWDPLPITVPTYVTKPRAGRTVRTVQLGDPDVWTSGHVEGEDVDFPATSSQSAVPATERAVGE